MISEVSYCIIAQPGQANEWSMGEIVVPWRSILALARKVPETRPNTEHHW